LSDRLLWGGAAAVLAAGSALVSAPAPARADPISSCTTTSGVIVAVDFSHWGGNIQRGCDASPTTGYAALHEAGFSTAGTQHDGAGFICRIDNYPAPSDEACVVTPPASAYWSYWHANAGQSSWSYSQLGAQSYKPKPGSVDAWVFGATNLSGTSGGPSFTPDQVRAKNAAVVQTAPTVKASATPTRKPTKKPTKKAASTPMHTATAAPSAGHSATASGSATSSPSAVPSASASGSTSSTRSQASSATTSTGSSTPSASTSGPAIVDNDGTRAASATTSGSGTPWPTIGGIALIVVVGGAAVVAARRRAR
jgi:hypothetical protein